MSHYLFQDPNRLIGPFVSESAARAYGAGQYLRCARPQPVSAAVICSRSDEGLKFLTSSLSWTDDPRNAGRFDDPLEEMRNVPPFPGCQLSVEFHQVTSPTDPARAALVAWVHDREFRNVPKSVLESGTLASFLLGMAMGQGPTAEMLQVVNSYLDETP